MKEKIPNPCPICGRWKNRPVVVDGVVVDGNGRILLVKRGREPEKGKYAVPGGFVDWNETAREAVLRELKEETGLTCSIQGFIGYYDAVERDPLRRTVSLAFYCIPVADVCVRAGDDAAECAWFLPDKLPPVAFDHIDIINDFRVLYSV